MDNTVTGSVDDIKAPNIIHSRNGSLYIRNTSPPRYLPKKEQYKRKKFIERGRYKNNLTNKKTIDNTYTRTPVRSEAMKVPITENVTIAPKFEKNGF